MSAERGTPEIDELDLVLDGMSGSQVRGVLAYFEQKLAAARLAGRREGLEDAARYVETHDEDDAHCTAGVLRATAERAKP